MPHDPHHEHLIKELEEQLSPILSNSPQGIYLYLDDEHKTCNALFADLLGYKSIEEWIKNEFPVDDVAEEDKEKVIQAYMEASENMKASSFEAAIVRKDGKKIQTQIIMAPLTYKGETFVIHFVSEK